MRHKIVVALSMLFKTQGGMQRFNQMLCLALDELAPRLALSVDVLSLEDDEQDYLARGAPWRHLRFIGSSRWQRTLRERAPLSKLRELVSAARGACAAPKDAEPTTHEGLIKAWREKTLSGGAAPERLATLAWQTWNCCRQGRPDLLIVGLLGMAPLGLLCQPWLRRGYGFIAHGTECWLEPRRSRQIAARRAAFALAVSDDTARALVKTTGMLRERIRLLPNTLPPSFDLDAVDLDRPLADVSDPRRHGPRLLTVARLWADERMKGVDHTIEVFAELAPRFPAATYRIIGKGSDRARLEQLARGLGLADRVRFEQDLTDDELIAAYRDCDLFVLPSGQEGFGIVFLEAMRFSKPCIGGAAGGTPEVIDDGVTGLLVPFGDKSALKAALERLLGDAALRERLGQAGRLRLEQEFVFSRFRQRLEHHLEALLHAGVAA